MLKIKHFSRDIFRFLVYISSLENRMVKIKHFPNVQDIV